jgi:hypothetical protein
MVGQVRSLQNWTGGKMLRGLPWWSRKPGSRHKPAPPIAGAAIPNRQGQDRLGQRRFILPDAALGA